MEKNSSIIPLIIILILYSTPSLLCDNLKADIYVSKFPDQPSNFNSAKIVREYIVNQTAYFAFIAHDFTKNENGEVDLSIDFKFKDPNGNEMFSDSNYAKAKNVAPSNQTTVVLDASLDITLDKSDPLGMYTLEVTLNDNVSNEKTFTETTILLFDTEESRSIIMSPVKSAEDLDVLWNEYFRSENPWAVKRIISALRMRKESKYLNDAIVGSAAKWSLEVNGKKFPKVYAICQQALLVSKGSIKELLQEIVNAIEDEKDISMEH